MIEASQRGALGRRFRGGALVAVLWSMGVAGCAVAPATDPVATLGNGGVDKAKVSQQLAEAARQGGDYAGAIELYRRMLAAGGDPLTAHLGLGDVMLASGALDDAEKEYQAAVVIAPSRPEAQLGMGRLLMARHRPAEALAAFDMALRNGAPRAVALNGKGLALDLQNHHAEAQNIYREGLADAPQDRVLRSNYGLSLALSGDYKGALALLMPLAQDAAASVRNRQNLALVLGLNGDTAAARSVALHDLSPEMVDANMQFYEAARMASVAPAATPAP
ncbi:MAG TPA: tetratricopeptide repeat protein [Aliidongia sp.]|uniref:tetratricopeptide repeat protein n=1 Tax=Aliidongia sp. TaxID=1914230 RepID=UPI002DDD3BE5|nr:tetratricopeptide repeat protein [Aliidongia sp.]HEV2676362.1 tetratricopeptide repeat protein [Aliidongia sp.]